MRKENFVCYLDHSKQINYNTFQSKFNRFKTYLKFNLDWLLVLACGLFFVSVLIAGCLGLI